jgi:hypothetical protein
MLPHPIPASAVDAWRRGPQAPGAGAKQPQNRVLRVRFERSVSTSWIWSRTAPGRDVSRSARGCVGAATGTSSTDPQAWRSSPSNCARDLACNAERKPGLSGRGRRQPQAFQHAGAAPRLDRRGQIRSEPQRACPKAASRPRQGRLLLPVPATGRAFWRAAHPCPRKSSVPRPAGHARLRSAGACAFLPRANS